MAEKDRDGYCGFLCKIERALRHHVHEKPGDLAAHTDLAACLLLKAVYRSGQDSILQALEDNKDAALTEMPDISHDLIAHDVSSLLLECLQNLQANRDVSPDPVPWIQNNLLFMLLQWFTQDRDFQQIEQEANQILSELTETIIKTSDN